jgi:endo-1,4-beta-mannosidase
LGLIKLRENKLIEDSGKFFVGCNYWASHAGTAMWSDWRPEIVEKDLKKLAEEGLEVLRVFPLWPDFQPIDILYGGGGQEVEYRFGEEVIPDTEMGKAGVSEIAMSRFMEFTEIAKKYNLKLIVGLITGWMSGRLFVPPALKGRDLLTDKTAIMWQVKFVKCFVKTFKDSEIIAAWDLGNECNCMGRVGSRDEAWVWTAAVADAIKASDSTRPLVSGMHSLTPAGQWRIQDQAELTDILTTHPYPFWTPYTDYDPVNTIRPLIHATAESLFYSNIGHKPCFAEETGTMGPMVSSDEIAGDFARTSLFSLWAHDCHGFLWWCANDQNHLLHAPYDWVSCERELGLLRENGEAKPVLKEIGKAKKLIDGMPFKTLPPRKVDAVCITNSSQDHWAVAYSSFILSKQAGFDIEFQHEDQPLKDSKLYLLPCIRGVQGIRKHRWTEILKKVSEGAALYVSIEDGYIADFEKVTGLKVNTRSRRSGDAAVSIKYINDERDLKFSGPIRLDLDSVGAEVLGAEQDGNPVFTVFSYGKGKIYFMSFPLEMNLIQRQGVFCNACSEPYWNIYKIISEEARSGRIIEKNNPFIGITEHTFSETSKLAVLINYSPEETEASFTLKEQWKIEKVLHEGTEGSKSEMYSGRIAANNALILYLKKI